jgi:hypothetical protein
MKNQIQTQNELSRDAVALRAYQLWEAAGRPAGRDAEHWLQAEAELRRAGQLVAPKPIPPITSPRPGAVRSAVPVKPEPQPAKLDGWQTRAKVVENSHRERGSKAVQF